MSPNCPRRPTRWCTGSPPSPHVDDVMVAASIYCYVYVSTDGGENWNKLQKEFGEIRSLALTPNE